MVCGKLCDNFRVLTIWRRHRRTCDHRDDRYYKKCRCRIIQWDDDRSFA